MPEEPEEGLSEEEMENDSPSEESGGGSNKFMMIAVVLIALLGAYFVANVVVKPMMGGGGGKTSEKKEEVKEKKKDDHGGGHDSHGSAEGEHASDDGIFRVEGVIVNPAATGGSRFLTTTIGFELKDPSDQHVFKSKEIKIRDALISILSSKTVSELADLKSREMIRKQILKYVNQICQPAEAEAIYFVDFVLQ